MHPALQQAAQHLAALDAAERDATITRLRSAAILTAPDDKVERKPPIKSLGEFLATEIDVPPDLVMPGVLVRGEISALIAGSGYGKTHLTVGRLLRWAAGRPLFNDLPKVQAPTGALRILLVENEGAPHKFQQEIGRMLDSMDPSDETRATIENNMMVWDSVGYSEFKIDIDEDVRLLRLGIEEHKPDVIVLDPFARLWAGDENDNRELRIVLSKMSSDLAVAHNVGILLVHHERKGGAQEDDIMRAARGGTAFEGHVGYMERFTKISGGKRRQLACAKWRHGYQFEPIVMEWEESKRFYRFVPPSEEEDAVYRLLEPWKPSRVDEIAEMLEVSKGKVRAALIAMLERGKVRRDGNEWFTGDTNVGDGVGF